MTDKYKELANRLPVMVMKTLGIEVIKLEGSTQLIADAGTHKEHIAQLTAILAIQAALFKYALPIAISLKPESEGIITINHMREQTLTLLNLIADRAVEGFIDENISVEKIEVES